MKTYSLIDNQGSLQLLYKGKPVSSTDLLSVFPNRRVYAMHGNMGAGKTSLIKIIAQDMGVTDIVNSPTFAIVNVYDDDHGSEIYHFDCYRLKNIQEAFDFGAEEYIRSGNYCFIEWPDIIAPILPEDTVHLTIIPQPDNSRLVQIS